ncbi:hypothetical protein R1sor_020285 [Riccia sorocarpa]|uniref:Peptidase A2 domain-containing protein n=1 Tax=Riccia sorocarpa TaxID=122646 RepID=A0ABD3IEV5_9MARC
MTSKGKEPETEGKEELATTTPPRMQLDPETMRMFDAMRLFLQQQQAGERKESLATDALRSVIGKLDQFDGKNISKFLKAYKKEMELMRVPEDEMIRTFELAVTQELRGHVRGLMRQTTSWDQFARLMREQYFLEDADRITKRSFLEWVEKPDKRLSATELLREFDSRYSQLTRVERMMLEDMKTELFLRAADPELQGKLEVRLEDTDAEGGLTTDWQKVDDVVNLLAKLEQRKEKGVVRRFAPTAPLVVPVAPVIPAAPVVQPRHVVPRKDDPSLEDIMKGMRDLSLKLTRLEEKGAGEAAKPARRQGWVQRCIWCDGTDHARRECEDFSLMMGRGTIFWKDGKVALRDTGEELRTNFGKGGMKKIVEDYLVAHSVAAVEAVCYGLEVDDGNGEDFTAECYVKPSQLWKSAVASMRAEKTPIEVLARTASTIRGETGWNDPVETLAIHAYIAKSHHEALFEEKRHREEAEEGTSAKRQTREEAVKEKGKGPAYKLQSDIEAVTDLKAVLEARVLDAEVKFSLRQILGIAKKEFHDIIIDIVKRKRQLTEDVAQVLTNALGAERMYEAQCCLQAPERRMRVRFKDEEDEPVVNPSHYTRDHWARATGETMVKLDGLEEPVVALIDHGSEINLMSKNIYEKGRWPIDTDHNWKIKAANNTHCGLLGACPGVKLRIGNVEIEQNIFVQDGASYPIILGQPFITSVQMETKVLDDGSSYARIRSKDGKQAVQFLTVPANHERNRDALRRRPLPRPSDEFRDF